MSIGDINSDQKGSGARFNSGKPDFSLIPLCTLEDEAKVWEYGKKKYAEWNWCKGMNWSVPFACMMRHMASWQRGEENDAESGLPHLAHAMCNLRMLTLYSRTYKEGDHRPIKWLADWAMDLLPEEVKPPKPDLSPRKGILGNIDFSQPSAVINSSGWIVGNDRIKGHGIDGKAPNLGIIDELDAQGAFDVSAEEKAQFHDQEIESLDLKIPAWDWKTGLKTNVNDVVNADVLQSLVKAGVSFEEAYQLVKNASDAVDTRKQNEPN